MAPTPPPHPTNLQISLVRPHRHVVRHHALLGPGEASQRPPLLGPPPVVVQVHEPRHRPSTGPHPPLRALGLLVMLVEVPPEFRTRFVPVVRNLVPPVVVPAAADLSPRVRQRRPAQPGSERLPQPPHPAREFQSRIDIAHVDIVPPRASTEGLPVRLGAEALLLGRLERRVREAVRPELPGGEETAGVVSHRGHEAGRKPVGDHDHAPPGYGMHVVGGDQGSVVVVVVVVDHPPDGDRDVRCRRENRRRRGRRMGWTTTTTNATVEVVPPPEAAEAAVVECLDAINER